MKKLQIKENLDFTKMPETEGAVQSPQGHATPALQIILAILLLSLSASIFFIKNLIVLTCVLLLSLIAQKLCKRKIYIIPHLSLWLFIFISMIFVPNGEVLFKFWIISITKGSLTMALQKALILSTVSALSQCAVCLKPGRNTLLGLSFEYYRLMINHFTENEGTIINKITYSLNLNSETQTSQTQTDKSVQ